ncbi:MAG: tetratricopeptide repeat protein [Thermoanaerobaculia bacterium]
MPKTNPVRLLVLIPRIHDALLDALAEEPENVDVRVDLVRFYMVTPSILGGDVKEARAQAAEIARRDPALGHFARGYVAYREKEYGPARHELRDAMKLGNASTRALAAKWLGWLSQETQQWDEAFAMFEELQDQYEIARTAEFCGCRLERGRAALREFLRLHPKDQDARKLAKKLQSKHR